MSVRHTLLAAMFFLFNSVRKRMGSSAKPVNLTDLAKYTGPDRARLLMMGPKKRASFCGIPP